MTGQDEIDAHNKRGEEFLANRKLEIVNSGPAVHFNEVFVSLDGASTRLTFCEKQLDVDHMQFRAAVVMDKQRLMLLADTLAKTINIINEREKVINDLKASLLLQKANKPDIGVIDGQHGEVMK